MSDTLKPCPFCGMTPIAAQTDPDAWLCPRGHTTWFTSESWNHRVTPAPGDHEQVVGRASQAIYDAAWARSKVGARPYEPTRSDDADELARIALGVTPAPASPIGSLEDFDRRYFPTVAEKNAYDTPAPRPEGEKQDAREWCEKCAAPVLAGARLCADCAPRAAEPAPRDAQIEVLDRHMLERVDFRTDAWLCKCDARGFGGVSGLSAHILAELDKVRLVALASPAPQGLAEDGALAADLKTHHAKVNNLLATVRDELFGGDEDTRAGAVESLDAELPGIYANSDALLRRAASALSSPPQQKANEAGS